MFEGKGLANIGMAGQQAPTRQTEVSGAFNNLRKNIEICEKEVEILGQRLHPIRTPRPEKPMDVEESAPSCGLAEEINFHSVKIAGIALALKTINAELEL